MLVERTLHLADRALNYAEGPASGPPLILLHGVTRNWHDYAPLWPALLPRWHVHALDFRGHGRSSWTAPHYRVVDYVADVVALLEHVARTPAVVYGHSLGAMVAAAAAAQAPRLVRAVVLEDPPWGLLGEQIAQTPFHAQFVGMRLALAANPTDTDEMAALLGAIDVPGGPGQPPRKLRELRDACSLRFGARCLRAIDPALLEPLIAGRWMQGYDAGQVWRQVQCPALLLQGETSAGGMLTDEIAADAAQTMARCSHVKLTGVGHLIHWLQTEATLRLLLSFLESLD